MSLQLVVDGAEDIVEDNDSHSDNDGESGATRRDTTKTVLHYRVELPPYFHGDGKDKESFSLWKTRLELTVKACAEGQQLDIATILPTRLSGDALAYWLSLPPDVQQDYEKCAAKLNEVFGRKKFLLHFQTFVNARQRLPKEPLEVYAAEITRLVIEAFPEYGKPAIAMERFRRFVAGLDPILQSKCHEHGAATLEDALAVACKWERAQEALKLLPPPVIAPALTPSAIPAPQEELFAAMVSTRHKKSQSDPSSGLFEAVKQLSNDLHALRLEVSQLGRNPERNTAFHMLLLPPKDMTNKMNRGIGVAEKDTVAHHLRHLTVADTLLHDIITDPAGPTVIVTITGSAGPAVIITPDIPLLTVTDDTHLLLHLLHLIDIIIILLTSRIASGRAAQTGATPLIVRVHDTHIKVTLTDSPPMTLTHPGMIHTLLSLPGQDTNNEEKETIVSASLKKTPVREKSGSRC